MLAGMEKLRKYEESCKMIDSWLKYQQYIQEIPGLAVGVFVENKLVFNKMYGYADIDKKVKLNETHLFRIASLTKLFTASAIMQLVHKGKIDLDAKISNYLHWFNSPNDTNLQHITIKNLLTHSSGIQCDIGEGLGSEHISLNEEVIKDLVQTGISKFGVGEILKYSNLGMQF